MGFYKKIILFLIFISGLAMLIAKLCLAQEDSSLFVQNQDIKQKIYSNNRETETIAKDLNSIENEMDDAHLMVSAEEIKQDTIIAQKIIFLIDSLATKEVEKESLVEQNKSLTQKMLSLISEKQTEKANLTRQNQVLTQKITSLINALAEKEAEKENLVKENQALSQEISSFLDKISEEKAEKYNPGQKKKMASFLIDLSKKEIKEKEDLRSEIANLKKTLNEERAMLHEKLGAVYIHAKMYNEAMDAYEEALTFNPNNPIPVYYLGLLYKYTEKDSAKAVQYLRRYIKLAPKGEYIKKAQELIKILE
jgi:tetratricopeptide (TPR) repeat protein